VEPLEKPVVDRVLQAMAQAYPDPVDLYLLSMVMGCDVACLRAATAKLLRAGLAHAHVPADGGDPRPASPRITDRGMAVAVGVAADAAEAGELLDRLEAQTLRSLLSLRVRASRLPAAQAEALCAALVGVPDAALVDAAQAWAHQPVSDWRALIGMLLAGEAPVRAPQPVA